MTEARSSTPQRGASAGVEFVRSVFNFIASALTIGVVVMCFVNVFGSSIEVDRLANETACQGQPATCRAQYTMWERTPWAHTLQLSTPAGMKTAQCQREYVLVGAWSCAELGKAPALTPSVSAVPSVSPSSSPPRSAVPKTKPPGPIPTPSPPTVAPAKTVGSRQDAITPSASR